MPKLIKQPSTPDLRFLSEKELVLQAQDGNVEARRQLHTMFGGMLDSISFNASSVEHELTFEELRLEAGRILDKCINSYMPDMQFKFSTYMYGVVERGLRPERKEVQHV